MQQIMRFFWKMCWMQVHPSETPYSLTLCWLMVALNVMLSTLMLSLQLNFLQAATITVLTLLNSAIFIRLMLALYHYSARFLQVFTALMGMQAIIEILIMPLFFVQFYLLRPTEGNWLFSLASIFILMGAAFLQVWLIVMTANLFRHALSSSWITGILYTVLFIMANAVMRMAIFGGVINTYVNS